jgi:hypothetical protein
MTSHSVGGIAGVVTAEELRASGDFLASVQTPSGQIPWFENGHCDPWNHVEAAMALCAVGRVEESREAFRWLAGRQLVSGGWFNYYQGESVKSGRVDLNTCGYIATGIWHNLLITGDVDFAVEMWPTVERALDLVARHQRIDGAITWSVNSLGRPERDALLTGSSSLLHALRCGIALGERLGRERLEWEVVAGRLHHAIVSHPDIFTPKPQFAMDWYYPVLAGAVRGSAAVARFTEQWSTFVLEGCGVRCVSTNDWVTAAETAECTLALLTAGLDSMALELFATTSSHRLADGSYLTGIVYPQEVTFPTQERSTYTVAAVILASDALTRSTPGSEIFMQRTDQVVLDLPLPTCQH